MSNTISVKPCGDFELWIVSGRLPDDFAFTLPIKCAPFEIESGPGSGVSDLGPKAQDPRPKTQERLWFVRRAMSELSIAPAQYKVLTPILDAWNYSPDERGWWFRDSDLRRFAVKAPGITPEYYIVWPGVINNQPSTINQLDPPPEPGFSSHELSFLKDLHYSVPEISWDALKVFWLQIRAAAVRRLADRKILDLGFIKIIPMPYRENWKEAIAVRFSSLMSMFGKVPEERHEAFTLSGFYGALASPKLLAFDRRKQFVHWTLEMIPSPELEKRMEEHELARKQKLCASNYTSGILNEMASHLPAVLDIMKWYAVRVFHPPATVVDGIATGSKMLVPAVLKGLVRPGRGICDAVALTPDDAFQEWTPDVDRRKPYYQTPLRQIRHNAMIAFKPSQPPGNGRAPNRVFQEDKNTKLPACSTHSQFSETVPDQLQEGAPDGTGEASG